MNHIVLILRYFQKNNAIQLRNTGRSFHSSKTVFLCYFWCDCQFWIQQDTFFFFKLIPIVWANKIAISFCWIRIKMHFTPHNFLLFHSSVIFKTQMHGVVNFHLHCNSTGSHPINCKNVSTKNGSKSENSLWWSVYSTSTVFCAALKKLIK